MVFLPYICRCQIGEGGDGLLPVQVRKGHGEINIFTIVPIRRRHKGRGRIFVTPSNCEIKMGLAVDGISCAQEVRQVVGLRQKANFIVLLSRFAGNIFFLSIYCLRYILKKQGEF